jgi:hypothetical protein
MSRAQVGGGGCILRAPGRPVDLDRYALRDGSRVDQVKRYVQTAVSRKAGSDHDLLQAQESPVEAPRFDLAPSWSRHLHVIQADYADRNAPAHRRSASTRSDALVA